MVSNKAGLTGEIHYRKSAPKPIKPVATTPNEKSNWRSKWRSGVTILYNVGICLYLMLCAQGSYKIDSRSLSLLISATLGLLKRAVSSPNGKRVAKAVLTTLAVLFLMAQSSLMIKNDPDIYKRGTGAYGVLGVPVKADEGTVRSAYKKLSRSLHPDKVRDSDKTPDENGGDFELVSMAYNTIKKPLFRILYDRFGILAAKGPNLQGETLVKEILGAYQTQAQHYLMRIIGELAVMILTWDFTSKRVTIVAIFAMVEQLLTGSNVSVLQLPTFQVAKLVRHAGLETVLLLFT